MKNPQLEIYAAGAAVLKELISDRRVTVFKHKSELIEQRIATGTGMHIYFSSSDKEFISGDGDRRWVPFVHPDKLRGLRGFSQEWITDDETPVYRGPVTPLWTSAAYPLGIPEACLKTRYMWVEEGSRVNAHGWESTLARYCEHDVKHPRGGF